MDVQDVQSSISATNGGCIYGWLGSEVPHEKSLKIHSETEAFSNNLGASVSRKLGEPINCGPSVSKFRVLVPRVVTPMPMTCQHSAKYANENLKSQSKIIISYN